MPGTIETDGARAPERPPGVWSCPATTRVPAFLTDRWQRFSAARARVPLAVAATVIVWAAAAHTWILTLLRIDRRVPALGWDLVTVWRAEGVFAHGGQPYNQAATAGRLYLYPPSSLLVLRPIAALSLREVQVLGLVATAALVWATVMITSAVLGRRWWGLTSAVVVFALHWAQPVIDELKLENVTVLCAVALAVFFLLATREHFVAAAVFIGLSLAVKPLLLPVVLVFLLARKPRAFCLAVAIPAVLNAIAFAVVADPNQVWAKLPSLLDRSGGGVVLNSAWIGIGDIFGLPDFATILLRLVTVALVIAGAWWSWRRLADPGTRLITTSSVLLIGAFLAGTLSEDHFMLVLVPLAMTAIVPSAPMRWFTGWVGVLWIMGLTPPGSWFGLDSPANQSAFEAFGMALCLVTVVAILSRRHAVPAQRAAAHADAGAGAADASATTAARDAGTADAGTGAGTAAAGSGRPAATMRESNGSPPVLDGAPIR